MRIPVRVGFVTKNVQCGTVEDVKCPTCGKVARFSKVKNIGSANVLFIPIAKSTKSTYVFCHECGTLHQVYKKRFKTIHDDKDVLDAVMTYQMDIITGKVQNELKREQKKLRVIGVILMIMGFAIYLPMILKGNSAGGGVGALCALVGIILLVRSFFHEKYKVNE